MKSEDVDQIIKYYESWVIIKQEEQNNFSNYIARTQEAFYSTKSDSEKIAQIGEHISELKKKNREFALQYLINDSTPLLFPNK